MIFVRLLTFHLDNLVGSTNGLDPTDLKSGRVRTQGPGGNRRLCFLVMLRFCSDEHSYELDCEQTGVSDGG